MATSTYLSSPIVTVNAVDLSDQCTAATVKKGFAALDATAFGDTATKQTAGLQENEVTLELFWSFAATETYATLKNLVGSTTNVTVKATSAATSATNPLFTLTGGFLAEMSPVYTVGELSTCTATFTGGTGTYAES